jgi:hypothetical protein
MIEENTPNSNKKILKVFPSFVLGICNCGCGESIDLRVCDGYLRRFKHGHNRRGLSNGPNHPNWGGGEYIDPDGYKRVYDPTHPNTDSRGYVKEHVKVMVEYLGRPMKKGEHIHHINQNRLDNRISNMKVVSISEHMRIHMTKDMTGRICKICNLDSTGIDYKGYKRWFKFEDGLICKKCYERKWRSERKKKVSD